MEQFQKNHRYKFIDLIRGIAVILMVFFHLFYDLNTFGFVEINFFKEPFWFYLPRVIVTLFMFSVGVSICMAHGDKIESRTYLRRLFKIGFGALIISVSTYFMFPNNWIYFGTLHCIFFTTIIITPFRSRPYISLIIAIVMIALEQSQYAIPFPRMKHDAMDFIGLAPWSSLSFLGIFAFHKGIFLVKYPINKLTSATELLGKHSFLIYVTHQIVLYGLVYLAYIIFK